VKPSAPAPYGATRRRYYGSGRTGDYTHGHERFWPVDDRRPWETVTEWCRRLDTYVNPPEGPA
jgi:hypothetical protein